MRLIWILTACLWIGCCLESSIGHAQDASTSDEPAEVNADGEVEPKADVPEKVEVDPENSDDEIARRLEEIFEATGWFDAACVRVDRGVVFLTGSTASASHQEWAEKTAMRTSDVVAVVNQIRVRERPFWDLTPAWNSLITMGRTSLQQLPLFLVALLIAVLAYYIGLVGAEISRRLTQRSIDSALLRDVMANVIAVLIFIVGVYIALRVSGLTRLAVTLLGGTGLVGLALGFAFRDIAENYLSSILISLNHPFNVGDLIEVDGSMGFVRKVTTRGTILSTLDGNQIQIPNSTVYKNKVLNYTATPLSRLEIKVGIGFDDSIAQAQEVIMKTFQSHNAVMEEPSPLVLVESLGSSTVNLRCLYWFDQTEHSGLKVGSALIRQVKQALSDAEISMPDDAREIIFPSGVPVEMIDSKATAKNDQVSVSETIHDSAKEACSVSAGEGDLTSEQDEVLRATEGEGAIADDENLLE